MHVHALNQRRHDRTRYDDVSDDKQWMGRKINSTHEKRQVQLITQCYRREFARANLYFIAVAGTHFVL